MRKVAGIALILVLLTAGVYLVLTANGPGVEKVAHERALIEAFGLSGGGGGAGDIKLPQSSRGVAQPVTVDPAVLPVKPVESQYELWLRGVIDLDEEEGLITVAEKAALQAASLDLAPRLELGQNYGLTAPVVLTTFDSIDITQCCTSGVNVPPDPEMAAGPNHLMAVVNVAFEIYDYAGTSLAGPTTFATLFQNTPGCNGANGGQPFDPNVLYDEEADRFFLGIAYVNFGNNQASHYCMAASASSDPTGSWNTYAIPTDFNNQVWLDYPHAGVGDDAIYLGANMFGINPVTFIQSLMFAFDKSDMYAGTAVSYAVKGAVVSDFTPQPLNLHGMAQGTWPAGMPHYFAAGRDGGDGWALYAWDDPFGDDEFGVAGVVHVSDFTGFVGGYPIPAVQSGGDTIDFVDWRPFDFEYRNGYGWVANTVACNPGAGTVDCAQWAQIDLANVLIENAGILASDGDYRIFPDLAINHCNDMLIGYTKTSASTFPSVYVAGRLAGDPPGQVGGETLLKNGEVTYFSYDGAPLRWGDYTGMTIAPDGLTFWYLGEYSKNLTGPPANWGNYVGAFEFAGCTVTPDFALNAVPWTQNACAGDTVDYDIVVSSLAGFTEDVTLSAATAPGTPAFVPNPVTAGNISVMSLDTTGVAAGNYAFDVEGSYLTTVHTTPVELNVYVGAPGMPAVVEPADGATNVSIKPFLTWQADANALSYDVDLATDAGFTNIIASASGIEGTSFWVPDVLNLSTTYYWRVRAGNVCASGGYTTASFTTTDGTGACPAGQVPVAIFNDDFETDGPGWTHGFMPDYGPDTWTITTSDANSPVKSYFAQDWSSPNDQWLQSPAVDLTIPLTATNLMLQFWNRQAFEDPAGSGGCWDGGMLEISTDGGTTWTQMVSELLNDPYDGYGDNGPPAGVLLWCGQAAGAQPWLNSIVNLDAYANESDVRFRYRLLTDAAAGGPGWWIDDFTVSYCVEEPPQEEWQIYLPVVFK
jgi:hypothetical protein